METIRLGHMRQAGTVLMGINLWLKEEWRQEWQGQRRMKLNKMNARWEIMREKLGDVKIREMEREQWRMNCKSHINPHPTKNLSGTATQARLSTIKPVQKKIAKLFVRIFLLVLCVTSNKRHCQIVKLWSNQDYTIQQLSQAPTVCRLSVGERGRTLFPT